MDRLIERCAPVIPFYALARGDERRAVGEVAIRLTSHERLSHLRTCSFTWKWAAILIFRQVVFGVIQHGSGTQLCPLRFLSRPFRWGAASFVAPPPHDQMNWTDRGFGTAERLLPRQPVGADRPIAVLGHIRIHATKRPL